MKTSHIPYTEVPANVLGDDHPILRGVSGAHDPRPYCPEHGLMAQGRSHWYCEECECEAPKKVVNTEQQQFDEELQNETVRVLRVSMDGYPDLILNSLSDLSDQLEWSFLGDGDMWKECRDGAQLTITVDTMPKAEFEQLEPWEA